MLQPKPLRRTRFNIFKNLSLYDVFLFMILVIVEFCVIFFGFPQINKIYKIVLPISFIPIIMLLFLDVKNTNYKVYQLYWIWFKFKVSKKEFKQKQIKNMMVFDTIDKNGLLKTNKIISKKQLYSKVFKLHGNSIFKYDADLQNSLLNQLSNSISTIEGQINIIKINNSSEFKQNISYVQEKINIYQDINSQNYLKSKKRDIENFKNQQYQEYYVLVYGDNEFKLNENIQSFKFAFESVNFILSDLNQIETLLFFNDYYKLNQTYSEIELKVLNSSNPENVDLFEIFDFKSIEFKSNYFKLNNSYYSVQAIKEFDYEVENGWLNSLYDTDSTIIINFSKIPFKHAEKLLESSNRIVGSNSLENSKHLLRNKRNIYEYQIFNELIENIVKKQQKPLIDFGFYIVNRANNLEELQKIEKQNVNNSKRERIKLSKFNFEQLKSYNQYQLTPFDMLNSSIQGLPELIGFSWPWNLEVLDDKNDFILGTQINDNSPILFDLFTRTQNRRNSNAIIIGTSGSGKSTLSKKLLLNEYYDNSQIIVIDPQEEYSKICSQVNGQYIDLKEGKNTIINPLQIQINEFNDENIKVFNAIDNHIEFVATWFEILFKNLSKTNTILIKMALKNLYKNHHFYNIKTLNDLKSIKKWPIINDFINELENTKFDNKTEEIIYLKPLTKMIKEFKFFFQEQTSYKNIFNQQSNINLNNKFIVFNVKKLLSQQNQSSAMAQIYLLLKIINTKISINSINKSYFKTVLFIDEAHFALKDNTPELMEFL
ncbi:VirB4 family type IV secretion system protein, partial [Mycoplasma sp. CSL7503-lung]|uniref:VirB4 family type IV secretion system protein n=1 Tax=Mycoplasma sp. CSL7503-lung TaxID=536372 RepID=UPI0021D31915